VRKHVGCETFTVQDYRNRYALYKLDPDLQAVHVSAPFIVKWDDHEIDNDWASQFSETNTPPEVFRLRRAAAFQAYYEAMPLRKSSFRRASHLQLFRQIPFGNQASCNVLDTRQYRSRQACRRKAVCHDFVDADRSMLGAIQEQWLHNNLARDESRWQVLVQQVPLFGREPSDQQQQNHHVMDKWSGYPAARERLVSGFSDTESSNVVILSGDIHSHWAADVTRRMAEPDGPSVAVELTTTSVSSGGNRSVAADYWSAMKADQPHVRYHSNRRGYLSCQVTHGAWQADYMTLDSVTTLHGSLKRDTRVVVTTGSRNLLSTKS
jgi:alkaline phosphatase D